MIGGVLHHGKLLENATVTVGVPGKKTLLTGSQGDFSFVPVNKTFLLNEVRKQGYVLVDPDLYGSHNCSTEPLSLAMEDPDKLQQEQKERERMLRRQLITQQDSLEDAINAMTIAQVERDSMQQELDHQRENNEKIVKELTRYTISMDYDLLNDYQREVGVLIEQGNAQGALALLHSGGVIDERIKGNERLKEEIAYDCQKFYEGYMLEHQLDSAAYILRKQLELDSLNIDFLNKLGEFLSEYMGDYPQALVYYERALALSRILNGETDERTATCHNNIGVVRYYQGRYDEAQECYRQALAIKEQVFGREHRDVATYLNNMGNVCQAQLQYDDALSYHNEALDIRRRVVGEESIDVALSYNNIGSVLREQHNYEQALDYYLKSMSLREQLLGTDDPATATCYNNIGLTYQYLKDNSQAAVYHEKALKIRETAYGKRHPLIATSCNNLGTICFALGDYQQALDYLLRAASIREQKLGTTHITTAKTWNNVGAVYLAMSDEDHALQYFRQALVVYEQQYGDKSAEANKLKEKIAKIEKK